MHAGKQPFKGQRCLSRSNVYQHMHPCVSDLRFLYGNLISCLATSSLPCIGDEEGLFLLGNCHRDISSHFKTYGLSKCSEHICVEVNLWLCRGGKLNIHIFFFFWQQSSQFRRASQWQECDLTIQILFIFNFFVTEIKMIQVPFSSAFTYFIDCSRYFSAIKPSQKAAFAFLGKSLHGIRRRS